jgi:cytochrome c553
MKTGARGGPTVAFMRGPVAGLTPDQITDITAYLASLKA